jgi:hypothetical protein
VPEQTAPPAPDADDGEKARGVLRLLEAGHFKGVADVRLRINFFDELSARATTAAQPVVSEQSGRLIETVNQELDQLLGSLGLDEEARELVDGLVGEFNAAVQAAVEEFTGAGAIDTAGLTDAIQSAFTTLVSQLGEQLTTPVPETEPQSNPDATEGTADKGPAVEADAAVPNAPADSPDAQTGLADPSPEGQADGPNAPIEGALASLTEVFNAALANLLESIQSATQLPDPSPPSGNGVAYAKFLAIYNQLRGLTPGDVDQLG